MTYNVRYKETDEMFRDQMRVNEKFTGEKQTDGEAVATGWLWEFNESELAEAERLNVLLLLIKWCVEHDCMTEILEDELFLYYEQYTNGELDDILGEDEAEDVIRDLTACYKKTFPDEEETHGEF